MRISDRTTKMRGCNFLAWFLPEDLAGGVCGGGGGGGGEHVPLFPKKFTCVPVFPLP